MTIIEARVWDFETKQMLESEQSVYSKLRHALGVSLGSGFSDIDFSAKTNKVDVMFFTGRKDAKGVKIFENDLCHFIIYKNNQVHFKYLVQIIYDESNCCYSIKHLESDMHLVVGLFPLSQKIEPERLHVIGNIYQHENILGSSS